MTPFPSREFRILYDYSRFNIKEQKQPNPPQGDADWLRRCLGTEAEDNPPRRAHPLSLHLDIFQFGVQSITQGITQEVDG